MICTCFSKAQLTAIENQHELERHQDVNTSIKANNSTICFQDTRSISGNVNKQQTTLKFCLGVNADGLNNQLANVWRLYQQCFSTIVCL